MKMRKRAAVATLVLGLVAVAWPSRADAQTAPFKVHITELTQLGFIDPGLGFIGDFYAKVTINGVEQSNKGACNDTTSTGLVTPFNLFKNFRAIDECRHAKTPWVFTADVPTNAPVHVKIQIFDEDLVFDDEADLKPGDGKSIDLVVNPGNAQWTGDLNWPQTCSRPTLAGSGSDVNACFQIGFDSDDDGLLDPWEMFGVDTDNDGVIDVALPALSAHAFRKDAFVELDHLLAATHSHSPRQNAIARVVKAFAEAPLPNPDGSSGIQLHVDTGSLFGAGVRTSVPGSGGAIGIYGDLGGGNAIGEAGNDIIEAFQTPQASAPTFQGLKTTHFNSVREGIFRYVIFGHQTNARRAIGDCTSGEANLTRRDLMVTLGGNRSAGVPCWAVDGNGFSVGSENEQAGTLLHEIGHAVGLRHGGGDETLSKPNYLSVMNYVFQDCSVTPVTGILPGACDYSRLVQGSVLPPLNEVDLDECVGIGGGLGLGPVDWNGSKAFEGASACGTVATNAVADVNKDGICIKAGGNSTLDTMPAGDDKVDGGIMNGGLNRVCETAATGDDVQAVAVGNMPPQPNPLPSFDDWGNVTPSLIHFTKGFGLGATSSPEADPETIANARSVMGEMMTPAITVDQTGPATAKPGDVLTYAVKVTNSGQGPAVSSVLTETNPDGALRTTNVGIVAAGTEFTQSTSFTVPASACPGDFTGARASLAYRDFPGRAFTAADTTPLQILDVAAPVVTVSMTPGALWAPNHKFRVVTATITVTDNCDPNPAVTLVSITSNEPAVGAIGQGDQGPDIQEAAFGTDDRTFALRAERETGQGNTGRVYTITYRTTDASGNVTQTTATVTVAINNSGK
jgi:uncharacterized repeat protein (TIGR01451 family)